MFAFGGRQGPNGSLSNAFYEATPSTINGLDTRYTWTKIVQPNAPSPRIHHALAVSGDGRYVYVIGGVGSNGSRLSDAHEYDRQTKVWRLVTQALPPRAQQGVAVIDRSVFVGGGVNAQGNAVGTLLMIKTDSNAVVDYGEALPAGAWPDLSMAPHGDGLVLAGGLWANTWYRDVWRVTVGSQSASSAFVHDFASDGLVANQRFTVQGDLTHRMFWGVPGYSMGQDPYGVWFVDSTGDGQLVTGGGSQLLRSAATTSQPTRATTAPRRVPRRNARAAVIVRPGARGPVR